MTTSAETAFFLIAMLVTCSSIIVMAGAWTYHVIRCLKAQRDRCEPTQFGHEWNKL